ncbi:guanine nucleotide exchange factor subunit RIC1-like isoform X2 [Watersipora subatra]|uniref:guanine nucleotide exchange factor subunit RIC1-like isoform X2 n=1 Tax=Watersipora subatra TaxID=2589382 RepID=UPI00355BD562
MYFPFGLPQEFRLPKESNTPQEPIGICSNRDRSLILLLTDDTLHVWFCKPCVQIAALQRSRHSVEERGKNWKAVWKSDATTIMVATDKGRLLFFKVDIDDNHQDSLYLKKGYSRKQQKAFDALFLGEGIPALFITELHSFNIHAKISSIAVLRDELVITTVQGGLQRAKWNGTLNETYSATLSEVQFSYDLQQSKGRHLKSSSEYITDVEFSPLLGGFVTVLSGGRGFFLTAPNAKFDRENLHGVWAPELRDAVCVHANHKYRLIVFGCASGKGMVYHIDPATGALLLSHQLCVSTKEYPDAGLVGGPITRLAWTPDECAIIAAWSKGGIAVWSAFGALLFSSLKASYGIPGPPLHNNLIVKAMEWGAEGYQLWLSAENPERLPSVHHTSNEHSSSSSCSDLTDPVSAASTTLSASVESSPKRGSYDFIQLHFLKSPLTVNPCLSNHKHLFLQAEDKLYINLGSDKTEEDASNVLIANKQWRVVPIRYTYLGSNWPIRFAAMDDAGLSVAIAGRTGLAHYSLLRRKWFLFGNEAQEKGIVVCGGLVWWKDFISVGCFNLEASKDEIRFYSTANKLDNAYCTITKIPYAVLLINIFSNYLICLCADRHIMLFSIQLSNQQKVAQVELRRIQDVNVNGFIPHPMCVTFVTLCSLSSETYQQSTHSFSCDIPESILMNVAGHLLMFQRDWSGPQPKQASNRYRAVPFCNPMKVASSVENVWVPCVDEEEKKELSHSLWLSSGSMGMKVWLTLSSQATVATHFMSKRIMLPFDVAICPLAVLTEDAVILGAASDHATDFFSTFLSSSSQSGLTQILDFSVLERTSEIYLHQVLRQLLRRNLGYHALQLARCFTTLPYFSHVLELLLHEVLEEEATSKEPIPDPLLPRVVLFSKEFPQYRKTVAHCARKTEIALWEHLFSAVGSPKALFEECLVNGDLDTASSYLIILQNLEKFYVSRQHATLLLESALESRSWPLARDVVRFLKRIDPHEADMEPVMRPLHSRYGQRYTTPPLEIPEPDGFVLAKPPLVRNTSLTYYDPENRLNETAKADGSRTVSRKHSGAVSKQEEIEKHDVAVLLYRHAKKLLSTYRIRDLGLFGANLEEYELVGLLRKERLRGAKIEDTVQALKQLHMDFTWPLPILTHSAFYKSLRKYNTQPPKLPLAPLSTHEEHITDGDLGSCQSTKEIVLSPVKFNFAPSDLSEAGTEASDSAINIETPSHLINLTGDLSRSTSESQLHDLSMELANRGPKQSELEIRYLFEVMSEAECYDWCLILALVLRDAPLLSRVVYLATSKAEREPHHVIKLSSDITKLSDWVSEECLGYKPFLTSMSEDINNLRLHSKRLTTDMTSAHNQHNNATSTDSAESDADVTSSVPNNGSPMTSLPPSESCIIS